MKYRTLSVAVVGAALLSISACGAGNSTDSAEDGQVIRVGETDGVPAAFLRFGEREGIFADHGIDIEIDASAGGAAAIPALIGGNLDIAGSNVVSGMLAAYQGLPIKIIAPGTFATENVTEDFSAVLVPEGSDLTSAQGLAGKSIAVNTLENIGDITIEAALQEQGVDTSNIQFVEIGFPQMLPALDSGRVDAAWVIEPFVAMGIAQGAQPVLSPYVESREGLQVGSFLATEEFIAENGDRVEAFRAAVAATAQTITDDPDAFRAALPEIDGMSPEIAAAMVLPDFKAEVDTESLRFIADRMRQSGHVKEEIDVDALTGP